MAEYVVQLTEVVKSFGELRAVDRVSLNVRPGEFLTLLGPSGCGKTTTLRMIGGFESPDAGAILIQGKNVSGVPPAERNTSMVFQDYALFPHMTVAENIAFGLRMKKVPSREIRARTEEALRLVNLSTYGSRKPHQLSGGQKQRVALARSLVLQPAVLLLDEPLGALDAQIRKQMQLELKNIQQQLGQTFIYVTHDQEESLTMSDQIAIMNNGRIEQLGSPEEVYETPATPFVASFLGDCNLLEGTLRETCGNSAIFHHPRLGPLEGNLNTRTDTDCRADSPAFYCVRPENISMLPAEGPDPAEAGLSSVKGVITQRVYRGVVTRYVVRSGNEEITAETLGKGTAAPGEAVILTWKPKDAVILPVSQAKQQRAKAAAMENTCPGRFSDEASDEG
jgi:spermidine/putrescine transport system ATP-binding protein